MSIRTPLGRARGLGSAKTGTDHWWMQRVTALALIPLVIWFVVSMIIVTGADHETALAFIGSPINAVLLTLLIIATFYHGQLGLQVVIEDYVHGEFTKVLLVMFNTFFVMFTGALILYAIFKLSFGG